MSESARRIPGQSIFERLMGRVYSRPAVGVSSSFYERFGLTDPWLDAAVVASQEDEGFFTFLSAAPYYARLRALRQRAWWSRRRLLARLAEASNGPMVARPLEWLVRGTAAMSGAPGTSGWLRPSSVASTIASEIDSAVVLLGTASDAATAEGGAVSRRDERPMDRALGRRGSRTRTVLADVVEDVLVTVPRRVRRMVRQVAEDAATLPIEQQVIVARRLARSVRSPLARLIEPEANDVAVQADQRPVAVALARSATAPSKGLRPVLSRSPALQTLVFEAPEADTEASAAPPAPRRRVARDVQPAVSRPSAHREAPVAEVARDVRTQRVTGRAGPLEVVRAERAPAVATATPTRPARRPTKWIAELAVGTEATTETPDVRYGLRAVRRPSRRPIVVPAATEHVVARSVAPVVAGSLGETLISASPVARSDRPVRRIRRRIAVAEGAAAHAITLPVERVAARLDAVRRRVSTVLPAPTSYVVPTAPEAVTPEAAPAPRRRIAATAPVASVARRAEVAPTAGEAAPRRARRPQVAAPVPGAVEPEEIAGPILAPRRRAAPLREAGELTSPTVRAVARAVAPVSAPTTRRLVPAPMAHVLVEPVEPSSEPTAATQAPTRRALARAAAEPAPTSRRVALARTPTAYVAAAPEVEAAPVAAEAPRRSAARRVAARAEAVQRVDRRGRSLLAPSPVDYLAAPDEVAPVESIAPVRRRAAPTVDTVTLAPVEPLAAEQPATARIARRIPAEPASTATPRAIVREGRQVEPARVVRTGSSHYAAARLELTRDDTSTEPVTRLAAVARRRARRPMPHVAVSSDFSLLLPELPSVEVAPAARPERGGAAAAAPTLGRVTRALRQVTAAVRASERAELTPVVVPAARRTLRRVLAGDASAPERIAGGRIEARPTLRADKRGVFRRATPVDTPVLLEIVLEAAPIGTTAIERVERRVEPAVNRPSTAPMARAVEGTTTVRKGAPVAHAAARSTWTRERPLRAAAETVRTADGRYERSPSRVPARFVEAAEEETPVFGLGSPALRRSRRVAPSLVPLEPGLEPDTETQAPAQAGPARRRGAPVAAVAPDRRRRDADQAPSWANRAATGGGTDTPMAGRAPLPRTGTILGSLARASTPEDVVRVLVEGGDAVQRAARELPQPAVRLIERIVEVQHEAERAAAVSAPEAELLSPRHGHQVRQGQPVQQNFYTLRPSRSPSSRGVDGVGASRVTKLASKLLQLIHLAEADKRKAQRHVRMAEEGSQVMRAASEAGEAAAGGEQGAPNISALKREVVEAVYRELQLLGMRRQEAMNDVWW